KLLETLHLIALQAAKLLAPPVIRELRHADRANRLANRFSLRQQNIDLTQLRDDLFGLMLLLGHSNVLSNGSIAYFREDHFSGGRPKSFRSRTGRWMRLTGIRSNLQVRLSRARSIK